VQYTLKYQSQSKHQGVSYRIVDRDLESGISSRERMEKLSTIDLSLEC
jgi:hypothetical protein